MVLVSLVVLFGCQGCSAATAKMTKGMQSMRRLSTFLFLLPAAALLLFAGCSRTIDGPRFWWDDRNQERLPEEYALPANPGDEDAEKARRTAAGGDDLSDDNLRDYRTNMDQKEEQRKKDSSLVDF